MSTSQKVLTVLAGLTLAAGAAFAQRIEESSQQFTFQGAWTPGNDANASGGSHTVSSAAGSSVAFDVAGTSFVLYRKLDPKGGTAAVTVDGKAFGFLTFYFEAARWQVPAFIDLDSLGAGPHRVVLTVSTLQPTGSQGTNVYIDALERHAPFAPSPTQQKGIERLNTVRAQAGLPPARLVPAINLAAQAHADYLGVNQGAGHTQIPGTQAFFGQNINDRLGYFGYDLYRSSGENIWPSQDGGGMIDAVLNSFYHRTPVVSYAHTEVGFGTNSKGSSVYNFAVRNPRQAPATRILTTYPGDNQTGVPVHWDVPEQPAPLPDKPRPFGYPLSLIITQPANATNGADTTALTGSLRGDDGLDVPVYLMSAATDQNSGPGDFFLVPQGPLAYGTTYTARLAGTDEKGNAFAKEWKFTTAVAATITSTTGRVDDKSYRITWFPTGDVVTTKLEWGPTAALGNELPGVKVPVSPPHASFYHATIPDLTPGTYHYRVTATDAKGNVFTTPPATFVMPGATPPPDPTPPGTAVERLSPGGVLLPNNQMLSPNKAYRLLYQPDGNLVLYKVADNAVIWASGTHGRTPSRVVMQTDGNLVMYGPDNNAQWHSSTFGPGRDNSTALLQDDGKLVIINSLGQTVWENGAATPVQVTPPERSKLIPGASMLAGQSLYSVNRTYRLWYQTDGNLVVYREADGAALWSSGTSGKAPGRVCMQVDGNLVMYGQDGAPQWATATNTAVNVNSELVMQTDGNLVIYNPNGAAVWSIR